MPEALDFFNEVTGVNLFIARNAISRHITPIIKGVRYTFSLVSNIFRDKKPKC